MRRILCVFLLLGVLITMLPACGADRCSDETGHIYKDFYQCQCGNYCEEAGIGVLSQNVRNADDGENKNISDRAPRLRRLVKDYQPDLIGTQEVTPTWIGYLEKYFADTYGMVGCSREGPDATTGEWVMILYRLDRFELLDSGDFWLSETPDRVSKVEGAICSRSCTWARLKDKVTGKTLVFANTHLDHSNDEVREAQAKHLMEQLGSIAGDGPLILTGDFNTNPNSPVYNIPAETLLDARRRALEIRSTVGWTCDSYGAENPGRTIDYCFYSDHSVALWHKNLNDRYGGYLSDHYGVFTELILK